MFWQNIRLSFKSKISFLMKKQEQVADASVDQRKGGEDSQ
jgi:hypothetical protein